MKSGDLTFHQSSGDEDINHLFFFCPFAANVWRYAGIINSDFQTCEDWFLSWFRKDYQKSITENLLILCWNIWEARNNLIFRHSSSLPNMVVHAAASIGENYRRNNPCHFKGIMMVPPSLLVREPLVMLLSPLLKEVQSVMVFIMRSTLTVEGDSKFIIDSINKKCAPPWRLRTLVKDILSLASNFEAISFSYVPREANFVANAVTNMGHKSSTPITWSRKLPFSALSAFNFDQFSSGCSRGFLL